MGAVEQVRRNTRWLVSRLVDASVLERFIIAIAAIILALLTSSVIIVALGHDTGLFMYSLLYGAVGTPRQISITLRQATMLILAGVAVAVAFRARIFNIGVQGQMIVGAFTSTMSILAVAPYLPTGVASGVILIAIGLLTGIIGGAAYAAIPGLMKAYADANEVITTIMLNFIAIGVLFVLVDGRLKAPGSSVARTPRFPEYVGFPPIVFTSRSFSIIGLGLALITVVIVYFVLTNTRYGYDLQTTGFQEPASAFSGVDPRQTIVTTMSFSGMIAGLTGAVYVIMVDGYFQDPGVYPIYGFDAIAVSLIAANNPLGVVPAGILFGGLTAAGQYVDVNLALPKELVSGIVGLIVLFVAAPEMFRMGIGRYLRRGGDK